MRYYVAQIVGKGQVFEYVLPGLSAEDVRAHMQKLYGEEFAVSPASEYFGGSWPNVTPED